jgi:hypothetical protein
VNPAPFFKVAKNGGLTGGSDMRELGTCIDAEGIAAINQGLSVTTSLVEA